MKLGFLVALAGLSAAAPGSARAAAAPRLLGFDEAVGIALAESPDLRALHLQEEALRARAWQALSPNNPTVTFSRGDFPALTAGAQAASGSTALSFTLAFPGKSLSQFRQTRNLAESTKEQALGKEVDVRVALDGTYAALTENESIQRLLTEEVQKEEDIVKLLERKYSMAQATEVDLLNERVILAGLRQSLIVAKDNREVLLNQFLMLIKKPGSKGYLPLIPQDIPAPVVARPLDELQAVMLRNQHSLLAGALQIKSVESALTLAWLAPFPDLQLGLARTAYYNASAAAVPGLNRDYSASVGVALPLFLPVNERLGAAAAKRDLEAARAQWESQSLAATAALEQLYVGFQNTGREKDNLETLVVPAAKASYDLTLRNYELGRSDFLALNSSRNAWIQAEQDWLDHKVQLVSLYDQLSQQLGCFVNDKEGPMRAIERRAVLVLCAGLLGLAACRSKPAAKEALPVERLGEDSLRLSDEALKNVELAKAKVGEFSDRLSVMGRIAVVEDRMSVVSARVAGRIDAVYVASGEQMTPGQPMAAFFSADYAVARDEYLQAKKQAPALAGDVSDLKELARKKLIAIGVSPQDVDALGGPADENPSSLTIRAPRAGVLLNKNAIVGNVNNVGDALFTIGDIDEVWFNGDIYPEDLAKVRRNQEVLVFPQEEGAPVRGTVSFVSPVIDAASRTVKIRVLMQNPGHALLPDMYVNGNLILNRRTSLQIPSTSLIRLRDQAFCFKRGAGNDFERVPVVVTGEQDGVAAVSKGLKPGDEVVAEGALLLDAALTSTDSAQ